MLKQNLSQHQVVLWASMLCNGGVVDEASEFDEEKANLRNMLQIMRTCNHEFRICLKVAAAQGHWSMFEAHDGKRWRDVAVARWKLLGPASHLKKLLVLRTINDDHVGKGLSDLRFSLSILLCRNIGRTSGQPLDS